MRIAYLHAIRDSHLLMAGDRTQKTRLSLIKLKSNSEYLIKINLKEIL